MFQNILLPSKHFFFGVILGSRSIKYFNLHIEVKCSCWCLCSLGVLMSPYLNHTWISGDETRQRVKFTDDRVCKSHLLDCCPHDILAGTVSVSSGMRGSAEEDVGTTLVCAGWVTSRRDQAFCAQRAVTILMPLPVTCVWNCSRVSKKKTLNKKPNQELSEFIWNAFSFTIPWEVAKLFLF